MLRCDDARLRNHDAMPRQHNTKVRREGEKQRPGILVSHRCIVLSYYSLYNKIVLLRHNDAMTRKPGDCRIYSLRLSCRCDLVPLLFCIMCLRYCDFIDPCACTNILIQLKTTSVSTRTLSLAKQYSLILILNLMQQSLRK